jgi:hypothetical protein
MVDEAQEAVASSICGGSHRHSCTGGSEVCVMTTSAPVRKVHDIPIVLPIRAPRRLPAPGPEWSEPLVVGVPERVAAPVRREGTPVKVKEVVR